MNRRMTVCEKPEIITWLDDAEFRGINTGTGFHQVAGRQCVISFAM